jgi:hypothetical protein
MKHHDTQREGWTFCETLRVLKQGALLEPLSNAHKGLEESEAQPLRDKLIIHNSVSMIVDSSPVFTAWSFSFSSLFHAFA